MRSRNKQFSFDVALSFAGEDRLYVEKTADILKMMGYSVFYDKYEVVSLWGKDLYEHLNEIYYKRARYTVMFISKYYARKLWSNHERRSAQARAFSEHKEYILPVRFDTTKIPGILPTMGYIDLRNIKPKELAGLIKQKIGRIERLEFFPEDPDILYSYFKINNEGSKLRISTLAGSFFRALKLMTPLEREVLATAVDNTCPVGPPKNVHINIGYLGRMTSLSPEQIISLFSRLDCLGIKSRVYKCNTCQEKGVIGRSNKIIEIKYDSLLPGYEKNTTYIMGGIFECIFSRACPDCAMKAIKRVDLSLLGTLTGFPERFNTRKYGTSFSKSRIK